MGIHSTYTPEMGAKICELIADGTPLREICRRDGFPPWQTVYSWIDLHKEFAERIAHARELGYDAIAQDALRIADDGTNDYTERENERTGRIFIVPDTELVQRSKLRIETRLKLLSKWSPKIYGDKIEHEHKGNIDITATIAGARKRAGSSS